ncbi:MAG: RtcB family protein [Leptospiraceae bacterium]|nr:RtcB family protein [Leptospiraceae bacterium]
MPIHEIIETKNIPIKVFTNELEDAARKQLIELAESGIAVHFISAMPDVHYGLGATVGSVFASEDKICPNAVGVDIGCGMAAVPVPELKAKDLSLEFKEKIHSLIKSNIPTGTNSHSKPKTKSILDNTNRTKWLENKINDKVLSQIGTLGGGNHFIELVSDENDDVWIFLHSGSRGIGKQTAEYYNQLAANYMKSKNIILPNKDLNYLEIESEEGQDYLKDMLWCQDFAFENRQMMLRIINEILMKEISKEADFSKSVNIHHNYCACEDCTIETNSGKIIQKKLWITRKGATSARKGQMGLIPGSMGTGSFLVRGKGNPESWFSSSHGAGRRKSRTKAKAEISQADFEKSMLGIVCETVEELRDEAPAAYKDIHSVMEWQNDIVEILHKFMPLINVKGFDRDHKPWAKNKIKASLANEKDFGLKVKTVLNYPANKKSNKQSFIEVEYENWKLNENSHRKNNSTEVWVLSEDKLQRILLDCKVIDNTKEEILLQILNIKKREKHNQS